MQAFKQLQIFQLPADIRYAPDVLNEQLAAIPFQACLPSLPVGMGWVPPLERPGFDMPLVHAANGYMLVCLQIEYKLLPPSGRRSLAAESNES